MADKRFYITTPIYYVNGKPHIGHAYTSTAADAAARWQRACGKSAFLMTGTDEHGQKVLEKAVERGMTPIDHVDDMVVHWQAMMADLQITNDHFMRTTEPRHIACVQAVLQQLFDKGLMYEDTYVGWYSPSAERFWTEKDLVNGACPDTGQPVEKVEETNWFFRMSNYKQQLVDHIEANPGFIRPESRKNEILGFLRKDLGDLCISRPKSRMSWGIEIPFAPDFVTYVWFDALLNYVSGIGYHPEHPTEAFAQLWPADFHLVGKDILTTHAVYWSTMLMAMELPLPKCIYAHGWWMSADGAKMSKSLGNVIDVDLLVRNFGLDAVRFFLLREIGFGADGQFSYEGFLTRYNANLANDLGNLVHRGLSMTTNWLGGVVPAYGEATGFEAPLHEVAADVVKRFDTAMETLQFQDALDAFWELVRAGNKYVDDTAPWALNKAGESSKLNTALRTVLELSNLAAAFLAPFMPDKSAELQAKLVRTDDQRLADLRAALTEGPSFRQLVDGAALEVGEPLFPRIKDMPAEIADMFASAEPAAPKASKKKKKSKKTAEPPAEITFEDFSKVALRVGQVVEAAAHPDATKLLVLKVDVGEDTPRQIVAGIATLYGPDDLIGRKVVVVTNLAPANLRGVESQGMILAAGGKAVVDLVGVDAPIGEVVR